MQKNPQPDVRIVIEFREGVGVFLRNGRFASNSGQDVAQLNELLRHQAPGEVYSLFGISPQGRSDAPRQKEVADLERFYGIAVKDAETSRQQLKVLQSLAIVKEAYLEGPTERAL